MKFRYPVNIKQTDKVYFDPHKGKSTFDPKIQFLNFGLVYKNGIVFTPKGISEQSLPWKSWKGGYSTSFWLKAIVKSLINFNVELLFSDTNKALVLTPMSNNYFHWMTEVMPKLIYLKNSGIKFNVILHKEFSEKYQLESLTILDAKIQYFNKSFCIVNKLLLVSNFVEYPGYFNYKYIYPLKTLFKNNLPFIGNTSYQRIYITRKNATRRKVENEEKVIALLKRKSFVVIDLADFSLLKTSEILSNAKFIVAIHGAGLTNMIFAPPDCVVCEFLLEKTIIDKCYFNLANVLDLKYNYIMCKSLGSTVDHVNSDLKVPLHELVNFIKRYNL